MAHQMDGFVKGIILGGLVGAAIAMLYAPQSGRKTRRDIERTTEELLEKAKKEYDATLKKSGKAYESAVKELRHLDSALREKVGEMGEKVGEFTELGRDALHDTKNHLTRAANAAAHALK